MDPRLKAKSDLYVFGGYVLMGLAVLLNPFTIPMLQSAGYIPQVPSHHLHANDIRYLLPALVDVLFLVNGALIVFGQRKLRYYLNDSFGYNLFMFVSLLAIMFSLNVVHPGRLNGLRIVYLLTLIFFLTNAFYQAVVKKRGGPGLHPFYRNLTVSVFGILLLLIVLEGVFMFHTSTHRFNGTLGSRAWFLKHWELNAEGYRDEPYDSADIQGKRKVLVIGDSFVAGHGIKDPKDRFSDVFATKLPPKLYRVFNLGVGGSDTRDENKRLREFPYKPDMLIFSWYPNDIEEDGERGGLILQHARSYHDVWGPARYFARRSFLWNYIYWRFPHPDELSDYFGYIKQCFAYLKVRNNHLREIDRLVAYGDSLNIPMAAVVFPFLENAEGSAFATDEIEARFEKLGVPVVSVRDILVGEKAADFIVNHNDPHPNERLHAIVADSLFHMLNRRGQISGEPLPAVLPVAAIDTVVKDTVKPAPAKPKPSKPKPKTPSKGSTPSKPKPSDGKPADAKPADGKPSDPKDSSPGKGSTPSKSKPSGAKPSGAKPSDPKPSDAKPADPKPSAPSKGSNPSKPKPSDPKPADGKSSDPKPSGGG